MRRILLIILMLILLVVLLAACGGGEAPSSQAVEPLDVSGTYTGTMTIGKTQIVYDAGTDGNSKPYAVEETSSWDGTTADATFQFELADDSTLKIIGADGEAAYQGAYDSSTNQATFPYGDAEVSNIENTVTFQFEKTDDVITAKGKIVTVSDLPELEGLSNEVIIDLVKTE